MHEIGEAKAYSVRSARANQNRGQPNQHKSELTSALGRRALLLIPTIYEFSVWKESGAPPYKFTRTFLVSSSCVYCILSTMNLP